MLMHVRVQSSSLRRSGPYMTVLVSSHRIATTTAVSVRRSSSQRLWSSVCRAMVRCLMHAALVDSAGPVKIVPQRAEEEWSKSNDITLNLDVHSSLSGTRLRGNTGGKEHCGSHQPSHANLFRSSCYLRIISSIAGLGVRLIPFVCPSPIGVQAVRVEALAISPRCGALSWPSSEL